VTHAKHLDGGDGDTLLSLPSSRNTISGFLVKKRAGRDS